ncbi:hypothetical protein GTA08_BOTSDO08675 [Botryosphaeria dothidea]|uniref:BTB domain-containing protein n=1 Tax=Botryosphaeria dothidea TaxID=55169 RepID=A0A8H4ILU1_9PEZI|nr:hypothetical protein GTA08_BOTSDO08675 [Botryosphaeria dothidea]
MAPGTVSMETTTPIIISNDDIANEEPDIQVHRSDGTIYAAHAPVVCKHCVVFENAFKLEHGFKANATSRGPCRASSSSTKDGPTTVYFVLHYLYHRDLPRINKQEKLRSPLLFYADLYSMAMYYRLLRLRRRGPVAIRGVVRWRRRLEDRVPGRNC